jgi:hypothetical protein
MIKTKVALVSTGVSRGEFSQFERFMPMTAVGMHYIKAHLEFNGFDVKLINKTNDGLNEFQTINNIDNYKPNFVLFNQFFNTRDEIRKKIIPGLKNNYIIGVGGHDATFHSQNLPIDELTNQYSQFDFIWQGEVENNLATFLKKFQIQKKPQIINNLENRITDLDKLPILNHDQSEYSGNVGFLSTSRGCLRQKFSCDFCTTGMFYPSGWKARNIEHVIPELENLANNNKKYVFITEDNFLGFSSKDLNRGHKIIKYASRLDLKLMIMTTKDQILKADKKGYLSNWQGTVFRVFLGIENGSIESAIKLGKCFARNQHNYTNKCQEAISSLYRNGIALFGGYINFNPATTIKELEQSALFLRDNGKEAANFTNLSQGLRFYEGTKICKKYPKQAENYEIKDGEFFYEFHNPRVQEIYEHLINIKKSEGKLIERIDNLNYEITDLVYLNQIQNTRLGEKYFQVAEKRNQLNTNYFLSLCNATKQKKRLNRNDSEFLRESEKLEKEYKKVHKDIKDNVRYK